jgi:hypothetical protein
MILRISRARCGITANHELCHTPLNEPKANALASTPSKAWGFIAITQMPCVLTGGLSTTTVRCSFLDGGVHSRMPLVRTRARLKLLHVCDEWYESSRAFSFLLFDTVNSVQTQKAIARATITIGGSPANGTLYRLSSSRSLGPWWQLCVSACGLTLMWRVMSLYMTH